jgi:MFS family permease
LIVIGIFGLVVPFLAATIREPPRFERTGSTTPNLRQAAAGFVSRGGALVPLYLGMALLSIGDYGVLSWMPSLLSRRFAMSPAAIGGVFGAVSAAGGITGSLIGGILSDRAERRGGSRARLAAIAVAAFVAGAGAFFLAGARPGVALAGLGIWTFASALAGTGGMAALGVVVPNEIRGVGVSLVAFCNTLLGLGLGPTVVALTTDHVYRNPVAVGLAMATAIVPAGVLAALLFARSAVRLGRAAHTSVPA